MAPCRDKQCETKDINLKFQISLHFEELNLATELFHLIALPAHMFNIDSGNRQRSVEVYDVIELSSSLK